MDDRKGLALALEEARRGYEEGGIPVRSHTNSQAKRDSEGGEKNKKKTNG